MADSARLPIRVAFVTGSLSRNAGGMFVSVRELAKGVAAKVADVRVFGQADEYLEVDRAEWAPLQLQTFERSYLRPVSTALRNALLAYSPDVISVHGLWGGMTLGAEKFSRHRRVPVVINPHGMLDELALRRGAFKKAIARALYADRMLLSAGAIRALNESEAASIRKVVHATPIVVLPNGAPKIARTTSMRPASSRILLYLGRLDRKKHVLELLEAWSQLGGVPGWSLKVAGWGDSQYRDAVRAKCEALGALNVTFAGPLYGHDKDDALRSARAMILPSESEGLPVAILEAFAYGVAVLMSRACNLPTAFELGAALEVGMSVDDLKRDLKRLSGFSSFELEQLAERGRLMASRTYAWERISDGYVDLCSSLVASAVSKASLQRKLGLSSPSR